MDFAEFWVLDTAVRSCIAVESIGGSDRYPYSSPRKAFNAMRAATGKRDWRTAFASLTSASQDAAIFGAFDSCIFCEENATVRAAMTKFGLELTKVMADYSKEYRQKYGVDLDKLSADVEKYDKEHYEKYVKAHPEFARTGGAMEGEPGEKSRPSLPPVDGELLSKVVLRRVTDKAGFYADASDALTPKVRDILEPDYGDLKDVTVSGDKATGWVAVTRYHLGFGPGTPNGRESERPIREDCCFSKVNGKWYNGGLNDQTVNQPPTPSSR